MISFRLYSTNKLLTIKKQKMKVGMDTHCNMRGCCSINLVIIVLSDYPTNLLALPFCKSYSWFRISIVKHCYIIVHNRDPPNCYFLRSNGERDTTNVCIISHGAAAPRQNTMFSTVLPFRLMQSIHHNMRVHAFYFHDQTKTANRIQGDCLTIHITFLGSSYEFVFKF